MQRLKQRVYRHHQYWLSTHIAATLRRFCLPRAGVGRCEEPLSPSCSKSATLSFAGIPVPLLVPGPTSEGLALSADEHGNHGGPPQSTASTDQPIRRIAVCE